MTEVITALGWLCYAAAALALIVYIVHFLQRKGWKRPWNAAGLFFTSVALSQIPTLFTSLIRPGQIRAAIIVSLCLAAAAGLQAFSALRRRRERRAEDGIARGPSTGSQG